MAPRTYTKAPVYRGHPHCEAVVVVAQDRMHVDLDLRTEAGWKSLALEGAGTELVVPSMGVRVPPQ